MSTPRPRAALLWSVLFLLVLPLIGCGSKRENMYPESTGSVDSTDSLSGLSKEVLRAVNAYRARNGKGPLSSDSDLINAALLHSVAMGQGVVPLGHHGFDERKSRLQQKMPSLTSMAENVGVINDQGRSEMQMAQEIVRLWAGSPRHEANMLGDYMLGGAGAVKTENGKVYITAIFGRLGQGGRH